MSSARRALEPGDVVLAADFVVRALTPGIPRDWSVRAGRLVWDVDRTITHMAAAVAKYTLYLASRSTRFIAVRLDRWPDASPTEQLDAIGGVARALAHVAESSPPGTRPFHTSGMVDAEGFVGQACIELLVHGHDAAEGLGLPFEPPDDLCRSVVARMFPWLPDEDPPWQAMLRHTGRVDVPGRPYNDDSWGAVTIPLTEWDDTIPRRDERPVVEWVRQADDTWRPRYLEEA